MRPRPFPSATGFGRLVRRTGIANNWVGNEIRPKPQMAGAASAAPIAESADSQVVNTTSSSIFSPRRHGGVEFPRSGRRERGDRRYARQAAKDSAESAAGDINVKIAVPYLLHMLEEGPARETTTSKEELMDMYRHMTTIRRMEISADLLFKSQFIRGFCHLYDGQEAVCVGMEAALTYEDSILTAYRDHGNFIGRGGSLFELFSELMGKKSGCAIGKGGSMHMYKKENNFYGGWGIVGSSGPLGTGIGFANKYLHKKNVAVTIFGDGAANQYGMGTAEWRASKKTTFYDRLTYMPGIKVDGMDVFAVKTAFHYAKEHCLSGKGPIVVEADTYRYHGHSMSDPGSTYRDRSEIQGIRRARDPIEHLRKIMLKAEASTEQELKSVDKEIRKEVEEASTKAKEAPLPDDGELFSNIFKVDTGLVTYGCDRSRKVQLP